MSYLISLEGNIGSGKDSIIQLLKRYFNDDILFFDDSIYNWENEKLLQNFYKDPERWAFAFEVHSTSQKCKRLKNFYKNRNKGSIIFTKRSHISDKECFVKTCKEMEFMTDEEISIYENVFDNFSLPKYNSIIYLKSNVNKCYENIITKQGSEKTIQFKYIQILHKFYEEWIKELIKEGIPVLTIDIEKYRDLEGSEKTQESLLNLLLTSFPYLKKFLKVKGLYNEDKWTLVESKRKKKVMRFRN